ncbi:MAG: TonB-dependent receptor [Muribaculaceae bacterium]|nr:TonB-dependent receptor [Muribaculaceae bacterium]
MKKLTTEKCTKVHWLRGWLLCLLVTVGIATASAQSLTVTGTVTSAEDGEPLIGVTILIKGTSTGCTTDFDGNYSIKAQKGQTLVYSYVGYNTREIKVDRERIDVALLENDAVLDEVVVVGYGTQKKKLLTGATSQVKGDDIARLNTTSPLQALQGQMPGVSITSTSGQPGSGMKVQIRGLGTIGNSSPLYLIDGVGGDISTLNPNDIESIDVLKDAASAAIYGAQAANGVVLITTRSGKEGKAKVNYDGYFGWQTVPRYTKMLNSQEYMMIQDEQQVNSGLSPYDWSSMSSIWRTNPETGETGVIDTDWVKAMFKTPAIMQSHTIGVTGGSANSTYALSLGYLNQEGIAGGKDVSNYSRYNFRINSDHKLFNGILSVGEQVSFVYVKSTGIGVGNQYNNTLRGAFGTSPLAPIYNEAGEFNNTTGSDWYQYDGNPYGAMMVNTNNQSKNVNFNGNVYAQLEPIKNLRIRTVFGAVYSTSEYRSFTPIYSFSPYSYSDYTQVNQNMNHGLGMTWTNTISYDWSIKEHDFNALIGMEAYRYSGTYLGGGQGYLKEGFDSWRYAYLSNGTGSTLGEDNVYISGSPNDESRSVSYFARLGWNWKEKYMINFTIRDDGSSRFAKGHRFGVFPSVSAGWNISSENFMESSHTWLDFLKLRVSWGRVGNQNINNYQFLAPIKVSNTHYFFGPYWDANGNINAGYSGDLSTNWGAYPNRLSNLGLTWETSEQTNIGLDARLFSNRLAITLEYYWKNTKDWLVQAPIPATSGAEAPFINGGSVKNRGFEFNVNWNDVIGRDFSYSIGVNGGLNRNRVGAIPTEDGMIHGATNQLYDNSQEFYRAQEGHPIGYFWGYKAIGIFQNQKQINDWIAAGNGVLQDSPQPGDVIYWDVNHDGMIDESDKIDLGNGIPKFTYGININLYWKNFDLGVVGTGATGMKIVQSYRNWTNQQANYTTEILSRWTGEGTSNKIPRVTNQNINWQFSSLYLHDGDYFRISDLTIGYNFAPLINRPWCSNLRLYFQIQNLYTFTKYNGMDPEIGYGTSDWVSGVDLGFYPRSRNFLFGVNLSF